MIKFFTNRELSQRLGINLAKWKRWSREFLPPDPLGGLQSGYARQYNPNQAFTVHLGGHLVANGKFSIPETKQILQDLHEWLRNNGFYFDVKGPVDFSKGAQHLVRKTIVFIIKSKHTTAGLPKFHYIIRGIVSTTAVRHEGHDMMQALYTETFINCDDADPSADLATNTAKTLNISDFLQRFVNGVGLDVSHYAALS